MPLPFRPLALALVLAAGPILADSPSPAPFHRDARELAPVALIGLWKADLAASSFKGTAPRAAIRSFAFTEGGRVLVAFHTLDARGVLTSGHWAAQVDGTPAVEYHSTAGSIPFNVVTLRKIDETTLALTVTRNGRTDIEGTYRLSPDGQTLTYSYSGNVLVYHHWNLAD
jgi:hypothetical protein